MDRSASYSAVGGTGTLSGSRVTTLSLDGEGAVAESANLPDCLTAEGLLELLRAARVSDVSGRTFGDVIDAHASGSAAHRCTVRHDGRTRRFDVDLVRRDGGLLDLVLMDMTEREGDRNRADTLALELAHRTKNLLAVVQSLATQTARRTDNYDDFQDRFLGHVEALSSAHDLIVETGWGGTTLRDVVRVYMEKAHPVIAIECAPETDAVRLKPNAVQNMAIVLRELSTACAPSDRVRCSMGMREDGTLDLAWSCDGPHDSKRIWTDMLCRHAPTALDGQGMIDHTDKGFDYRLSIGPRQRV